jgi:hypothetical protein
MPRDGAITFRDIVGKLTVLRGIDAKLFDWSDEITADCPRISSTASGPRRPSP